MTTATIAICTNHKPVIGTLNNLVSPYGEIKTYENIEELLQSFICGLRPSVYMLDSDLLDNPMLSILSKGMREEFKTIPTIALGNTPEDELSSWRSGCSSYVELPLNKEMTALKISHALKESSYYNELSQKVDGVNKAYEEKNQEYNEAVLQTFTSLSALIDAKDDYTACHSRRVAQISYNIGEAAGLDHKTLYTLYHAGLLHDIGKIGIPDAVLKKPGKLTADEYARIKQHPVIGYELLKGMTFIPGLADAVRWHHERYDGKGYPDGIKGTTQENFMSRIIAIADSFDAMTSNRTYRTAATEGYARRELIKGSGTMYDPDLVMIAVDLLDKGTLLKNTSKEDFVHGTSDHLLCS